MADTRTRDDEGPGRARAAGPSGLSDLRAVARRLVENCAAEQGDWAPEPLAVPASAYTDPDRWRREMDAVFLRSPLVVALSADVAEPGAFVALELAGRPLLVVRGDDGVVRTFLNACAHRGAPVAAGCGQARRFTCPYHAWSYDRAGRLVGAPGGRAFAPPGTDASGPDVAGLPELPTEERAGLVLAVLTPGAPLDAAAWLGGMEDALAPLRLAELHRYETLTELESGNWKLVADGYVDGYHIGYLHRDSIGADAITNRNTFDLLGPHVRVGFATKATPALADQAEEDWVVDDAISLVWFLFPNVSIVGREGGAVMVTRLFPGPTPDRSHTEQIHYFRTPVTTDARRQRAEERRELFARVVRDEDYAVVTRIGRNLPALGDAPIRFGRNEMGNQHLHRTIERLVDDLSA